MLKLQSSRYFDRRFGREIPVAAGTLLDFDLAVIAFIRWEERKQNEQTIVSDEGERHPRPGQRWGPKFVTMEEIWDLYGAAERRAAAHDPDVDLIDLDRVQADVSILSADDY